MLTVATALMIITATALPGERSRWALESQLVVYRILQIMPAVGWEVELCHEDGEKEVHPLAGMALIERSSDHGEWYREVVGIFPCSGGGGLCTVYDRPDVLDINYRLLGRAATPV